MNTQIFGECLKYSNTNFDIGIKEIYNINIAMYIYAAMGFKKQCMNPIYRIMQL